MITESIWSNDKVTIPMAEVSHIIKEDYFGGFIIFKYSKTNPESKLKMKLEPTIWLQDIRGFEKDWCYYRAEFENLSIK